MSSDMRHILVLEGAEETFWCHAGAQGARRSRSAASMLPAGRKRPPRTVRAPEVGDLTAHRWQQVHSLSGMISFSSALYISLPAMPDPNA